MTDEITTMNIRIEGQVHGCGFRDFAMREANGRKLRGWVRNRSDGSVEAVAHGPSRQVEEFIGLCIKGPLGAQVTAVNLQPTDPPESIGFVRRPSL
jgi:acylphosphatase